MSRPFAPVACLLAAGLLVACGTPSYMQEVEAINRRAEEQRKALDEVQRLHRLGRFDEAQAISRQVEEQMQQQMRELQARMPGVQLPVRPGRARIDRSGDEADDDADGGIFGTIPSLTDVADMRREMENDERYIDRDPLFVRPMLLPFTDDSGAALLRMPRDVQRAQMQAMRQLGARDFAAAEATLQQALQRLRATRGPAAPEQLPVLRGLGLVLEAREDRPAALAFYRDALATVQASPAARASWWPWFQSRLASLHLDAGDFAQAMAATEQAAAALGPRDTSGRIAALNNVAVIHASSGNGTAAVAAYERARDALRAALDAPAQKPEARPVVTMAQGRDTRALEEFAADAVAQAQQDRAFVAALAAPRLYSNLGLAYWKRGEPARALDAFARALDARAEWDQAQEFLSERATLARAEVAAEELNAIVSLERALPGELHQSLGIRALLDRKGALLERQTQSMAAIRRESTPVAARGATIGELIGGFFGGTGGLERRAREQQEARFRADNRDLIEQYQAALAERSNLEQRRPVDDAEAARRAKAIADLDLRLQVMQREIQMRARQSAEQPFAPASAPTTLAGVADMQAKMDAEFEARRRQRRDQSAALLAQAQARLPADVVLLEMLTWSPLDTDAPASASPRWLPQRYATYVVRRDRAPQFVDLGPVAVIDRLVTDLRKALAYPRSVDNATAIGRRLDALLMAPVRKVAPAAPGRTSTYLLAPEGNLNLIPFGALVDDNGRFLVEHASFNYLPSARDLARNETSVAPRGPALILANPAFARVAAAPTPPAAAAPAEAATPPRSRDFKGVHFEPLPGTAAEAAAIKGLLTDAAVLMGERATETALKRAAGPRVLHLATHGFFLEEEPRRAAGKTAGKPASGAGPLATPGRENPMLRSGLVFAGVNELRSGDDDGVLTALEAAGLDLVGTKLVVLSACETGVGDVRNGEGVFGLRRAFVVAGAETLVMSLWPVDDDTTQRLMAQYYQRLAAGEGRIDALRSAQLALLADPKMRHPFFWASFIASGKPAPLN